MSDVITASETDRPVLSVMRRMRPDEMDRAITAAVRQLPEVAASSGLAVTGDAFGIFHGPITKELDGPLEVTVPVDGLTRIEGEVPSYRLQADSWRSVTPRGERPGFPTSWPCRTSSTA